MQNKPDVVLPLFSMAFLFQVPALHPMSVFLDQLLFQHPHEIFGMIKSLKPSLGDDMKTALGENDFQVLMDIHFFGGDLMIFQHCQKLPLPTCFGEEPEIPGMLFHPSVKPGEQTIPYGMASGVGGKG